MANIVLRDGLGRLLTKAEGDANFTNLNDELAQAESRFYGDVDPATINGVTVGPGFEWAHETAGVLKRRNAANNGWVVVGPLFSELATKSSVDAKVDKVTGKGLSTEDYTTTEKNKLAGVEAGATANLSDSYLLDSANHVYNPANSDLPASTDKTKGAIDILSFGVERLIRPDDAPCIIKTGANTVSVKAGTRVPVLGVKFDTNTAITMPTLTAGSDYSVWVHPDGAVSAVADPFTSPAAAPVADAVKIGGFHYGLVASGTTPASGGFSTSGVTSGGGSFGWTQADVDKIAGINEFSIWDLTWRCAGEQRGMAFDPLKQMWAGIYLMSDSPHIHGPSAYNTNVASGTVLPFIPPEWGGNGVLKYSRLSAFEAHELVSAFGLRLPATDEFMSFAFGVTEAQSLGGASVTIPATTRQPGYTSRIGIEQATGHQWIIGGPIHSTAGTAYTDVGRGQYYAAGGLVLLGGGRAFAANSGSRCATFNNALSYSNWSVSVRAAGDHLNLGRAAR